MAPSPESDVPRSIRTDVIAIFPCCVGLTVVPGTSRRMEDDVNVMDVARSIGLADGSVTGTIDEADVLTALGELAKGDPENADLFGDAAARVQRTRSAGVEAHAAGVRATSPEAATVQLRYRAEMADIFTDLAIDVGLRRHRDLVDATS